MTCPRCQAENPPGTRFCGQCAAPLAAVCPSCGASNPPANKFCGQCAAPLDKPAQSRFAAPESYTPKHLAEKILTSKSALEGERKQVTVLFADLKGSMELLADRDPEEARKLLDPVLEHMMEAVHRYEGTVNQVMGDGIMALFGAPLAHEDHAVRACYAALRMQEAVKRYAEDVRRREGVLPQIRVGLNSGEVVVRSIGSDLHMDYTAVGQTTHLAARMEQSAAPGTALLGTETLRLAEGYIQVVPLGPINVKGIVEAVQAYELTGAVAGRSRFQTLAARGLTKFVGRAAEIDQLATGLAQVRAGHGQVVAVVGEPGVGKSRLFWEFTRWHRAEGCLIVETGSVSYGKGTSYLPVIDLLRAYFQIESRDDQRKIREKVTGKLLSLDRALEPALAPLFALLDVPVEDADWTRLDPSGRRQRTLEGVKRLLLRETQIQPLIVVFEDLHWIDGETQAFLDGIVESVPTAKLLLLVNYRPEYAHAWSGKTYYRLLRIDPLPIETAEELLDALLGPSQELSPLKRLLIDRTQGNPFFLEESVRSLVETGALTGDRGSYQLAKPLQTLQIPATAQAILAARIDRLSPEDKRLLQTAAVIGKDVPYSLLHAVTDDAEDALRSGLARLQAGEFLYETRLFPELEYTFKHALTHEVTYGGLLQERRRELHARVASAIETLYRERLDEQVERLAHHALRGELWEKAVTYLRQAGGKAFARSALREAMAYFEQGLGVLQRLPESRVQREQAIDLRLDLRNTLIALGEFGAMFDHLRRAETLAEALNDQRRLGWVSAYLCPYFNNTGDQNRAVETGERALAIATASGEFALEVMATFFLGLPYISLGNYREASHYHRRSVELLTGEWRHERFGEPGLPAVFARVYLAWALAELGEFAEGTAHAEEAMQIAETVDQPFTLSHACWGVGILSLRKGDLPKAVAALERSLDVCQKGDIQLVLPWAAAVLGYAYALAGRLTEALPLLEQAVSQSTAMKHFAYYPLWATYLSEAYLLAGRWAEARQLAEQTLVLARDLKQRGHEAYALRHLAELAAHGDPPDVEGAETFDHQTLALAEPRGMRPLVAHCHFGLGKLYRRTGKGEQAREHLSTAMTMYREMDMPFWIQRADAETKEMA
jgi:predicted ATPase/class 3 adenylate cyclase